MDNNTILKSMINSFPEQSKNRTLYAKLLLVDEYGATLYEDPKIPVKYGDRVLYTLEDNDNEIGMRLLFLTCEKEDNK